jgi:zinc protease
MKRSIFSIAFLAMATGVFAQDGRIKFTEYDLPNGLHVILHQDHSTPIVSVSVMYHVGSKNEDPKRTGFAHFFEHLLFEGTENIERGEYMKLVQSNGGVLNAHTSNDITYYYEELPSNQLELGLWMEAERMLHAKVDSTGIETQREVVKEEKKQSYDNRPYGQIIKAVFENAYTTYPYKWTPIGSDEYINLAKYDEFMEFYKKFYVPNNAVLVVAGDFEIDQTKAWIEKYFASIPKGTMEIPRPNVTEPAQTRERRVNFYDEGINLPAVIYAYHIPAMGEDDYYAITLLNQLLSQGESSRFQKQLVDKDEIAIQVSAFNLGLEAPGLAVMLGIANMGINAEELDKGMNREIEKVKTNGVSPKEFEKLQNQAENDFILQNSRISGIAENLASNYTYFRNTNLINTELERFQKITAEDLKRVANKYFTKENRTVVYYLPKK